MCVCVMLRFLPFISSFLSDNLTLLSLALFYSLFFPSVVLVWSGPSYTKHDNKKKEKEKKMPFIEYDIKLDFKDVLFRPKRSSLKSRSQVLTASN